VVRLGGSLMLAAFFAQAIADRRGWVLGVVAFLVYGSVFGAVSLSVDAVRRWSARHVALDAALFVPFSFGPLLLIPALSWWAAAMISVAAGTLFVPFVVHRHATVSTPRGAQAAAGPSEGNPTRS
jgi:hypothetical protein